MSANVIIPAAELQSLQDSLATARAQRDMAIITAAFLLIGLILACALFGPAAYRSEQKGRTNTIQLPNR